jgi:hypothetical protein
MKDFNSNFTFYFKESNDIYNDEKDFINLYKNNPYFCNIQLNK